MLYFRLSAYLSNRHSTAPIICPAKKMSTRELRGHAKLRVNGLATCMWPQPLSNTPKLTMQIPTSIMTIPRAGNLAQNDLSSLCQTYRHTWSVLNLVRYTHAPRRAAMKARDHRLGWYSTWEPISTARTRMNHIHAGRPRMATILGSFFNLRQGKTWLL